MNVDQFLENIKKKQFYSNQIIHVEQLSSRTAQFGEVSDGLNKSIVDVLKKHGIEKLYSHQAQAIDLLRKGQSVVIVSGTASGKSLCYMVPALDSILHDPESTMLFIYPTKALTQDQYKTLCSFEDRTCGIEFLAGTYDGDTQTSIRRKLRDKANVVLTNPDMLHQGILPQHARWHRFFANLKYIVIDEIHSYRGIFGSHLTNVLRRLRRICKHYNSSPQFICCSATIANPADHASALCGTPVTVINKDGAPRGAKRFVFWNPPPLTNNAQAGVDSLQIGGERRGALGEAINLMTSLVKDGAQTIAFVKTRVASELLYRHTKENLLLITPELADAVHAYRGGYLPGERRDIEQRLASKEILGVASTNALELGIDIGSLDASLIVGYPGSIASLWQQAGRAGRKGEESLVVLIAQNTPIDQYLMTFSDYLFSQNPEYAIVDPDNPHITVGHIKCAASELPLSTNDASMFGLAAQPILDLLQEDSLVRKLHNRYFWASSEFPSVDVSLRNIAGPVFTIQDESENAKVIGTIDELSVLSQMYTHAVYLHGAQTYFVKHLDLSANIVHVEKKDLDYYTQSVQNGQIRIDAEHEQLNIKKGMLGFGDVTVTTIIPMFKKIRFHSRESIGIEPLSLPPQELETVSMWYVPSPAVVAELLKNCFITAQALTGIANVLLDIIPLYVMCDSNDIGTVVDSQNCGADALFIHDKYPGGMGYARRCLDLFDILLETAAKVIRDCQCQDGCPSCVGAPMPLASVLATDDGVRGSIPAKNGAKYLLELLLR